MKLTDDLFREYNAHAKRKRYSGQRADLRGCEGFAWFSTIMASWCFLPLRAYFSLDTVIRVDLNNLRNL